MLKMEAKKLTYINVYQPLCLKLLRQYLQQDKNVLMRRGTELRGLFNTCQMPKSVFSDVSVSLDDESIRAWFMGQNCPLTCLYLQTLFC